MIETTSLFSQADRSETIKETGEYEFLEKLFVGLRNADTLNGIVLKGGFLLMNTLSSSRMTQDIDFSIDREVGWNNLVKAFKASVDSIGSDRCEIVNIREPQETMSGKIEIRVHSLGTNIGIDASWEPIEIGSKRANILGLEINTYTLSHILADKYCVMYSKKRFRRTKDLYDIYNILSNFDIDYVEFDCVVQHNRNQIDWERTPMREDVYTEYNKAWDKLIIKVLNGDGTSSIIEKPDFAKVFNVMSSFILDYLSFKETKLTEGVWNKRK